MNKVVLMGRLTRDPDVRYTQGDNSMCIARYTLAVDRRFSRNNNDGQTADFISCVAFGRSGEFAEKYLHKGTKIAVSGRIQTGSYTNRDGVKIHTTEVVAEAHDFAGRKNAGMSKTAPPREKISSVHGSSTDAAAQAPGREASGCSDTCGVPYGSTDLPEDEDDVLPFRIFWQGSSAIQLPRGIALFFLLFIFVCSLHIISIIPII
jgi:single-strand DNA-binding protein